MYDEHLALLEEWNEDTVFYPTVTTIHMTELGVMVSQDIDERTREYRNGVFVSLSNPPRKVQLVALYGDDDRLFRLVVFENGKESNSTRNTQVLVNDAPIRG